MSRKYFFLLSFAIVLILFSFVNINFVSAQDDCTPGAYNSTHFCNLNSEFELLKVGNCTGNIASENCAQYETPSACDTLGDNKSCYWTYPSCVNDYECLSGECTDGTCESPYQEIKRRSNFFEDIWDSFISSVGDIFSLGGGEELCVDSDNDNFDNCALGEEGDDGNILDCDDSNSDVYPNAVEICGNGIDEDCDGSDLACAANCTDNDLDGYGNPASDQCSFASLDCNDTNENINLGMSEICNDGLDNNCDGLIDTEDSDCVDTNAPKVELLNVPSGIVYPDSEINLKANISDETAGIFWDLSSDVSEEIISGTISGKQKLIDFSTYDINWPKSISEKQKQHVITLTAKDSSEDTNENSTSFTITIKNENCTDGKDNDFDKIIDDLDKDCKTEADTTISLIDDGVIPSKTNVYTHRTMIVDCKFDTLSQDSESIKQCMKVNVSDVPTKTLPEINLEQNKAKFRGVFVGGNEMKNTDVTCYISPECNTPIGYSPKSAEINITKFSICSAGKDSENADDILSLNLIEPDENEVFYKNDTIIAEAEIENKVQDETLDFVFEAWLYDVYDEKKLESQNTNPATVQSLDSERFEINMTVSDNFTSWHNNRVYYKAYAILEGETVCYSDSIRLFLQDEDCLDEDDDGYCVENDCNDSNKNINPGADEICTDDIDNNCDGLIDSEDPVCQLNLSEEEVGSGQTKNIGSLTTTGTRRTIYLTGTLEFVIGESHSVYIKSISENSAVLEISSEPFDVSLLRGQTKDVNIDEDNEKDLRITLNDLDEEKSDLTLRAILAPSDTGQPVQEPETQQPEEKGSAIFIIIIIVLIIAIAIVAAFIYLRKTKLDEGKKDSGSSQPSSSGPKPRQGPGPGTRPRFITFRKPIRRPR